MRLNPSRALPRVVLSVLALTFVCAPLLAEDSGEVAPAAATSTTAAAPSVPGLVYLGLNAQGAEEWYRPLDGAVVLRVPRGDYLKRPYEGWIAEDDPAPVHVDGFFVDRTEVTNEQFARFLNAQNDLTGLVSTDVVGVEHQSLGDHGAHAWRATPGRERHPVTAATGAGALAYAKWIGGRLPWPNEWEKAASGTDGRLFPWGDDQPDATRARFGGASVNDTLPVGSFAAGASPYGAVDMAGNAYERVYMGTGPDARPVMIKGGSWVSANGLNLRVLDLCVQTERVADRSVGFRCVMDDPQQDRATQVASAPPVLRLATDFESAVAEARAARKPLLVALFHETCGQSDRTREQLFHEPRFIAYCNEHAVVVAGHHPSHAEDHPHAPNADGTCPHYRGLTCEQHMKLYAAALKVVKTFVTSPGMFVLDPDKTTPGAGDAAVLVPERALPKWGNAADEYVQQLEAARKRLQ